jgi:uncharacterized repeat protein (TIGR03803 family)
MKNHLKRQFSLLTRVAIYLLGAIVISAGMAVIAPDASAQNLTVLYSFKGCGDGFLPWGELVRDQAGNLYGTTAGNGKCSLGTVFEITPAGTEVILHNFTGIPDATDPKSRLLKVGNNLYGTAQGGGAGPGGVVFKVTTGGQETAVYNFLGNSDGARPAAGLIRDKSGNFYGTTFYGGTSDFGTVYELDASGHESVLYKFTNGPDGSAPQSRLILDSAGNLYGTTSSGGNCFNCGAVFKLTPSPAGATITVLHSFAGGSDGAQPLGGLVRDSAGNLFGTTFYGGSSGLGTVFKIDTAGNKTTLHDFTGSEGAYPQGDLLLHGGTLYGVSYQGGTSLVGTVYKMDKSGHPTVLHNFTGADGAYPLAGVIWGSDGNLYGTTGGGGASNNGTVFRLVP